MVTKKPTSQPASRLATPAPVKLPKPPPFSMTFEFFETVAIRPGEFHGSSPPKIVDGFQWLHVWVQSISYDHTMGMVSMAMANITVELNFEFSDKMSASGLANLEFAPTASPMPIKVTSGDFAGTPNAFVIRTPIIGPSVCATVFNNGARRCEFTLWGYCTR